MATKKVKSVIELLKTDGWKHERTKGDHRIFVKKGERPIVIAGHDNDDMPIGTWMSIRRRLRAKD